MTYEEKRETIGKISRIMGYVEKRWYEDELGVIEPSQRWYAPAMYLLHDLYDRTVKELRG